MSQPAREIVELLAAGGVGAATATAAMTGLWGWLTRRTANKAEVLTGEAAILAAATRLQEVMNEAAERATARLTAELEAANERARLLAERADQLEGEIRQLRQHSESLENILRRQGIDIPAALAPDTLVVVEGGSARVQKARRKGKGEA